MKNKSLLLITLCSMFVPFVFSKTAAPAKAKFTVVNNTGEDLNVVMYSPMQKVVIKKGARHLFEKGIAYRFDDVVWTSKEGLEKDEWVDRYGLSVKRYHTSTMNATMTLDSNGAYKLEYTSAPGVRRPTIEGTAPVVNKCYPACAQ